MCLLLFVLVSFVILSIDANALAVITSNIPILLLGSIFLFIIVMFPKDSLSLTDLKKKHFFALLSIRLTLFFGFVIAKSIPGKPPPEPRSKTLELSLILLIRGSQSRISFS